MKRLFEQFVCYMTSRGQHLRDLDDPEPYGDKYCIGCGAYKYTEYDQKLAIKDREDWFKMWWQS